MAEQVVEKAKGDPRVQKLLEKVRDKSAWDAGYELNMLLMREFHEVVSVAGLREILGRGSNTTLQNAINASRRSCLESLNDRIPSINAPTDVQEAMAVLWLHALRAADASFQERYQAVQLAADEAQRIQAVSQQEVEKARSEVALANQERDAALVTVDELRRQNAELAEQLDNTNAELHRQLDLLTRAQSELEEARQQFATQLEQVRQHSEGSLRRMEEQFRGLTTHLHEETARERTRLSDEHAVAMQEIAEDCERMTVKLQRAELSVADVRRQLQEQIAGRRQAETDLAVVKHELAGHQEANAKLEQQIERLMVLLERGLVARPAMQLPDLNAMSEAVVAAYEELQQDVEVLQEGDLRIEATERYQDAHGFDLDASALLDHVLNDPSLRGRLIKVQWRE